MCSETSGGHAVKALHGCVAGVQGPALGLMLCGCHLEILNTFTFALVGE